MRKVAIFGANSAIAQATARRLAARGDSLFLFSRNREKLEALVQDLQVRGSKSVGSYAVDLNDIDKHEEIFERARKHLNGCDLVLLAHGDLGREDDAQKSFSTAYSIYQTNFLSAVSLCTIAANYFEAQKSGCIAAISSVAGDRGRQSNYIYGSAKGALTLFLQGLRNRLFHAGVHVLTIKPGFVDTPMTAGFKKGPLWAKPDAVAHGIVAAIDKKKNTTYLPGFWFLIMTVIKTVPEFIFKRARL
jgi:decaprenylphospho-beta-D-erythro-pentofuranosid-2-ulose 2-reductase